MQPTILSSFGCECACVCVYKEWDGYVEWNSWYYYK